MNFKYKLLVFMVLLAMQVYAQSSELVSVKKGIQIGENVPEINLDKIVETNGTLKSAKLSDYKDRLVILDFMYSSCVSCILGLPKKEHLQQKFGDKIKIMVVVGGEKYSPGMLKRENEAFVRAFLKSNKFLNRNNVKIPWVVENEALNQYFPHKLVSHLVWIYKGELVAITEQGYVTDNNIQLILDGKMNNLPVKNDFPLPMDTITPLIKQDSGRFKLLGPVKNQYAAVFGSYQDGVYTKSGTVRDTVNHTRRDFTINMQPVKEYISRWSLATGLPRFLDPSFIILEVEKPEMYVFQEDSDQMHYEFRNNSYICYEALSVDTGQTERQFSLKMINDLDNLLGLHGRFENRKMKCLVLYKTDNVDRIKHKGKPGESFGNFKAPDIEINNMSLDDLVWKINQFYGNPPVFNETNYAGGIDMKFTLTSWRDTLTLNKVLEKYGLTLREEERAVEVFVLTEKNRKQKKG